MPHEAVVHRPGAVECQLVRVASRRVAPRLDAQHRREARRGGQPDRGVEFEVGIDALVAELRVVGVDRAGVCHVQAASPCGIQHSDAVCGAVPYPRDVVAGDAQGGDVLPVAVRHDVAEASPVAVLQVGAGGVVAPVPEGERVHGGYAQRVGAVRRPAEVRHGGHRHLGRHAAVGHQELGSRAAVLGEGTCGYSRLADFGHERFRAGTRLVEVPHPAVLQKVAVVPAGDAEPHAVGGVGRRYLAAYPAVGDVDGVCENLLPAYLLPGGEGDEAREHGVDGRFAVDVLQTGVQVVAEGCRQHPPRLGRGVVAPRVEAVVGRAARASGNVCPGAERGHVAGGEERQLGLDEHRAVDGHLLEQLVEGVAPHVAGVECGGVVGGVEQGVPRPPRAAVVVAVTVSQDAVHPAAEPQLRLPVSGSPRNLQHAAVAVGASVVVHVEESRLEVGAVCLPRLRGVDARLGVGHADLPRPRSERHVKTRCGGTLGVRELVARSAYGRDVRVVRVRSRRVVPLRLVERRGLRLGQQVRYVLVRGEVLAVGVRSRRVAALGLVEGGGLRLGEVGREVDRRRVGRHVLPHPHLRGIALAREVRPQRLLAKPPATTDALGRPERGHVLQRICRIRRVDAPLLVELPHLADALKPFEHGSLRVVVVVDCRLSESVERRHQAYVPVGIGNFFA